MATTVKSRPTASVNNKRLTRGIHHVVFNTDDLKKTIDFYTDVLGMQLLHGFKVPPGSSKTSATRGNPPYEDYRHYYFDMGNDSVLAFFELPKEAPKVDRNALGAMQHISFVVETDAEYQQLIERLHKHGVEIIYGPIRMKSGPGVSMYFYDPNGIRLEASCIEDGSASVVKDATLTKSKMREELATVHDDPAWLDKVLAGLPD